MKIARIGITRHRLALDPPFHASWDSRPRTAFEATLVRVETDEGAVGLGSGDAMVGFAGHEALFLGRDPRDLERHWRVLDNLAFHYGRCWPLDLALWDLAGRLEGRPVFRMLGAAEGRLRAYASTGTLRDPGRMAELAQRCLESGFGAMKLRFHRRDWREDLAAVRAVREAVGGRLELMVDCNQGWRMPWDTAPPWDLARALEVATALAELDVYWMEEPLHRGDYAGMAALRERAAVRIAGAEMTREMHELETLIDRGCLDVLQPDAALTGGITGLARIARRARAAGRVFSPHTWTNGIGLLANAHLAAGTGGTPFLEYPFDPPEWTPERRDFMLAEPLAVDREGWIRLPERPGLGFEPDLGRLRATRL